MQIIAELEGEGRGAYTGSLGWLGTDGDADFNILIRTLTHARRRRSSCAPARASSRTRFPSASSKRRAPRRAACCGRSRVPRMSDALGTLDRRRARRRAAGRRSRPAVRRRPVRDHARARAARALPRSAPGAAGAGLRAPRHSIRALDGAARGDRGGGGAGAAARDPQDHRDARQRAAARLRARRATETPRRIVVVVAPRRRRTLRRRASICAWRRLRLGENPALAGIKHLNRLENVLAAAEAAQPSAFDVAAARCRRDTWSRAP